MNIPEGLKYTKEHEWVSTTGKIATFGITDYAQGELGDVVFVDIDPHLQEVAKSANFGTIEAVKTVSELYAPCSGKVIEINKTLTDSPEKVNSDPYGEGWMIKIEMANESELTDLLDDAAYSQLIGE
ncbi:MAG: glycine cleavage system protein H [Ignavibacteria bacterium CG_4_8_14_3_um_filter_37_9]|nr:glycine cleavage system protein GcvH [Ignavibacteria bacterium]OIO23478.1 MAG: glycine cleavage system protein H [Ignavibacteria bacterium CG1_02_37_35]PIP79592.1 MAG: glycine cleavage system protein H [Ignavibacteria bacterium CG22_combo_CG10-13_8_21_14_all_37_15]PIS46048.1 MAG: glycine cleavage system protein H [Ignavibacteria bacterium CG08_land_8_20_14_0_20_37_9]PIW98070.1 MAG: glycine cleavage system protein H [Ignavibacteria bacterium CG_4_8_14_3_um_filter_37_9]PIX93325.1 MAG: glycine